MSVKVDLPDWLTICLMPQIDRLSDLMRQHIDFHLIIERNRISLIYKNPAYTLWNAYYSIPMGQSGQSIEDICFEYQKRVSVITDGIEEHLRAHQNYILNKQSCDNPLIFDCVKRWERSIGELCEVYPMFNLNCRYTFLDILMCFYCECSISTWKKSFVSRMYYDSTVSGVIALEKLRMRRFVQAVIEKGEQLRERM